MMPPRELMRKLQVETGARLWLINVPRDMVEELAAGAEVEMVHEKDEYDGVVAFIDSPGELEVLSERILAELPPDGLLWLGYKAGAALDRAAWGPFEQRGWHPGDTTMLDDGWEAVRFTRSG